MSPQVLSALEENLRQEQRATCEQEFVTFKHLLTPIQVTAPACAGWCTCMLGAAVLRPPANASCHRLKLCDPVRCRAAFL